ncbi:phage/plasmid replication protein, II/X family [Aeromonas veronii]|uniref:phage/plasmid replication protein, II/X family n=1 Tax=Aeromonas veronii TaxID=654 RepID=UPI003F7BB580
MFVDYLKIFVPLVRDQRYAIGATSLYDGVRDCILDRDDGLWQLDFAAFSELTGTPLQARQVHFESGKASYTDLTSHWDSYASSEAYLAVRTVQARHNIGLSAGVEIQSSPATIAHIQNIISDIRSVELAAWIILSAAEQALPDIWPFLRLEGALVLRLDCTDGLYAETPAQAQQIIDRCRRVAYGQRKSSDTVGYKTSVYYGETSELHRGIAYHKGPEHQKKVAAAEAELRRSPTSVMAKRRLDCLKNPDLIAMADRQVRLEARWLKRGLTDHLTRLGCTPEENPWDGRLQSLIALERAYNAEHNTDNSPKKHSFISAFWDYTWHPVLDALTGGEENMDLNDTTAIEAKLFAIYPSRQARGVLQFYKLLLQYGWADLKASPDFSKSTFCKRVRDLVALGISRAQLQQLNGTSESRIDAGAVIPMVRVLRLSRLDEMPAWFKPTPADWTPFDPTTLRAVGDGIQPVRSRVPAPAPVFEMPADEEIATFLQRGGSFPDDLDWDSAAGLAAQERLRLPFAPSPTAEQREKFHLPPLTGAGSQCQLRLVQ